MTRYSEIVKVKDKNIQQLHSEIENLNQFKNEFHLLRSENECLREKIRFLEEEIDKMKNLALIKNMNFNEKKNDEIFNSSYNSESEKAFTEIQEVGKIENDISKIYCESVVGLENKTRIEELENKIRELVKDSNQKDDLVKSLTLDIKDERSQNTMLINKLNSIKQNENQEDKISDLSSIITGLELKNKKLYIENEQLRSKINDIVNSNKPSNSERPCGILDSVLDFENKSQFIISSSNREYGNNKDNESWQNMKISLLQKETLINSLNSEIQKLKDSKQRDLQDLKKTIQLKDSSINELKITIQSLKNTKDKVVQENSQFSQEIQELTKKVNNSEIIIDQRSKEIDVLRLRLEIVKRQLEGKNDAQIDNELKEKINHIIDEACNKNKEFEKVLEGYQNKTQQLSSEYLRLQNEYKDFINQTTPPIENNKDNKKTKTSESTEAISAFEVKRLRTDLEFSLKEYQELRLKYEELIFEKKENEERFLCSKMALAEENTNFKMDYDKLDKAYKSLSLDYNQLVNEKDQLQAKYTFTEPKKK